MAPPGQDCQNAVLFVKRWKHTYGDHLHVSAMKVTLELVHVLGDDALIQGIELTSTTVVAEGAFTPLVAEGAFMPPGQILFNIHFAMIVEG
jgi:hypothetical protein